MTGSDKNADQLRHAIDNGRSGDKVDYPDPAAAPLGTDDEAAGTPPTAAQVALSMQDEVGRGKGRGIAETDAQPAREGPGFGPTAYPAEKARGAEIILKGRTQRFVFFGGAILAMLAALVLIVLSA